MIREFKIAMLGFGSAGRAFAKLLIDKNEEISNKYGYQVKVVAIATKSKGSMVDEEGINLKSALSDIKTLNHFDKKGKGYSGLNAMEIAQKVNYDVLMEFTPLEFFTGQPAIDHIKTAFNRKRHAITANKGPIAWAYEELRDLAKEKNSLFYYETTVMDGAPVFDLASETLDLCKVTEINGILNTTTNFVLEEIRKGKTYDDAILESKNRGFMEANPATDIEGWDAAAKTAVLLNVLMGANISPKEIDRKGIEDIGLEQIKEAEKRGNVIRLICHGSIKNGEVIGKVEPKEISKDHIYSNIKGTSSVLTITTDLMRDITVIEHESEIEQTAYGIFSDLLRVIKNMK
ncbi:MAG: hypothetical protein ACTHVE_08300 [Senegalia sp. (in: firmicutes)]|uniref:hypothetical protein n=1 Tax=Senegalia sp. (in: firmicutes) TaxID=1924098 RepID=UPI003F971C24